MKKLIIEIPLEGNDLEETDFEVFCNESLQDGAVICLTVGRSISEEESYITREFHLSAEYFKVTAE